MCNATEYSDLLRKLLHKPKPKPEDLSDEALDKLCSNLAAFRNGTKNYVERLRVELDWREDERARKSIECPWSSGDYVQWVDYYPGWFRRKKVLRRGLIHRVEYKKNEHIFGFSVHQNDARSCGIVQIDLAHQDSRVIRKG